MINSAAACIRQADKTRQNLEIVPSEYSMVQLCSRLCGGAIEQLLVGEVAQRCQRSSWQQQCRAVHGFAGLFSSIAVGNHRLQLFMEPRLDQRGRFVVTSHGPT